MQSTDDVAYRELLSPLLALEALDVSVFVACSGGRDSLSLAFACHILYRQGKLTRLPILLHVHHGMQSANDAWADGVQAWADELGFCCRVLKVVLPKKTETHARDARYRALVACMNDGDVLLTAHHGDDQAETVLMRLINGAGVQGLSGMRAWQELSIDDKNVWLHRPWLSVQRKDISRFAHDHKLPYVDDPTNDTGENTRSFIRTQILPALMTINPKAPQNIARTAHVLSFASRIVESHTQDKLAWCCDLAQTDLPHQSVLLVDRLRACDDGVLSAVVHAWLCGDEKLPPTKQTIDTVMALILRDDGDHATRIVWQGVSRAYVVCRYQNYLYRYTKSAFDFLASPSGFVPVVGGGYELVLLGRQDKIPMTIYAKTYHLHGKKLYQTLKIPSHLRECVYVVRHQAQTVALVAPYLAWTLSKEQGDLPKLPKITWQILRS